ncbi:MAG TPA: hypothetical protein VFA21_07790 [Pyrinomonadaceae bacterium]|nr:hypothetical protein [Pyrinomonadaceae bacterium]
MPSTDKWRIAHLGSGEVASKSEEQIVSEFDRLYEAAGKPEGMALFSHTTTNSSALSITPAAVPYCASSPTFANWGEFDNPHGFGYHKWRAGDERLKEI